MKDVNLITPVSIKEQVAIRRWYIVSITFFILMIMIICIIHLVQLYEWYYIKKTCHVPLCIQKEADLTAHSRKLDEYAIALQKNIDAIKRCKQKLPLWSQRVYHINTILPLVESVEITKNNFSCTLPCSTLQEGLAYGEKLRAHPEIGSVSIISLNQQQSFHGFVCTIRGIYKTNQARTISKNVK